MKLKLAVAATLTWRWSSTGHAAGTSEFKEIVHAPEARVRRGPLEERDHGSSEPAEILLEPHEGVGVAAGEPLCFLERPVHIVVEVVVRAVREDVECGTRGVDVDAALHESHVAPNRFAEHRQDVGARRGSIPRRELFRHARPADDVAPLEDDRPHASSREVETSHQTVMAATDDDRVVAQVPLALRSFEAEARASFG